MNFSYCIEDKEMNFWYANGNSVMSGNEFHEFHEIIYIFRADGIFLSEKEKAVSFAGYAYTDFRKKTITILFLKKTVSILAAVFGFQIFLNLKIL